MSIWHSMEVDQVLKELNTDPNKGLRNEEAQRRLMKYGYNELKRKKQRRRSCWIPSNVLILLLLMAALLSLLLPLIFGL